MADDTATRSAAPSPAPAVRWRSRLAIALAGLGIAILLAIAATATWLSSERGLRYLIDYAVAESGGRIVVEGVTGSLLGSMHVAQIRYRDGATQVVAEDIAIDYAPRELAGGRLVVRDARIKRLTVDIAEQDDLPITLPDSLRLPLDLAIEQLAIERIDWRVGERSGTLDDLSLAYDGDRAAHRVRELKVSAPGARLTGSASLATARPFPTEGNLVLELSKPHPPGRIDATLAGDLDVLRVHAKSGVAGVAAEASVKLAPLASALFVEGRLDARDVNLEHIDAAWPATRLQVTIDARPAGDGLSGHAQIANALAGPIDSSRLPIVHAQSAFEWTGNVLALNDLSARLPGGGAVEGVGTVNLDSHRNRWKLTVQRLDLKALHSSLIATALAGRIDADVMEHTQRVVADVAQKDLRLTVDAHYDGKTIVADRLLAQAQGGSLEGKGRMTLEGARPYRADLAARRFNPARFGDFPAGALDGTIALEGTLSPRFTNVDLQIAPGSRFAGLAAQGRAQGRFTPATAQGIVADLTLGANHVRATGAVGRPGDKLALAIVAKRLAELAPLAPAELPKPLTGAVDAKATFETLARGGTLVIDARATQLNLGREWQFAKFAIEGRATHDAPLSRLRVDALRDVALTADVSGAVTPIGPATRARIGLTGTAPSHSLTFTASEGERAVDGRASGALIGPAMPFTWRGRIESLTSRGLPGIGAATLAGPATLELAADRVVLGPFRIEGGGALLDVDALTWRDDALASRGRFKGLPAALLTKQTELAARFPTDVTVSGAWEVASRPAWRGKLEIARERGDFYIDDPAREGAAKIALGLETLALTAMLEGRRLWGTAEMRAKVGGSALADFELSAPAGARHPFTLEAPVRAAIRAHFPSLATLQPWVGTSVRLQGQAIADVAVAGTLGTPALSGQLVGYGLRADMPQYGVSYQDGQLRIASGPDGLKLEELSFKGGDGRIFASGLIGLPRESGAPATPSRIEWRAEKFRALNRPDLRLIVDGEGTLGFESKRLTLRGRLSAEEGNIEYRSAADTTLADDIVVVGRPRPTRSATDAAFVGDAPLDLELALELGRNLRFASEGLETRLAGKVQVTSKGGGPIAGRGVIRTVRGTYWAFGQRLDIERGRVIFDGPVANPSLDIVALRKNLAVEAGVEISGTLRAPLVRLTSNPPVPDSEKLSWLLTGGPSGSGSAREAAALQAAASALLGRGGKPFTQSIAQSFGLDDISVAQRSTESTDPLSGQVVTLGKRLGDRLYIAYEQGLGLATNALRVEYALSRVFTLSAFTGTSSGIALSFRRAW